MPKKTFDTNVAMNWISADIQQSEKPVQPKAEKSVEEKPVKEQESTEKKLAAAPKEKKVKSDSVPFTIVGKELKTRQTSLLLKESTYTKLEALAKKNNISVNSCINQILEQVLN